MSPELINLIIQATGESLFMVATAALVATMLGLLR
jgi:D-methionine transport system permease protein